MKITYWSDYACPYCYIGEARLKKALEKIPELKGTEIEMKSFQLDPSAGQHAESDTQTRFAHKYGISMEAAGQQIETISRMGRLWYSSFPHGSLRCMQSVFSSSLKRYCPHCRRWQG